MRWVLILLSGLASLGVGSKATAHDLELGRGAATMVGNTMDAHATTAGNLVEGSVVVPGTVAALKAELYRLDRWPTVFSDARELKRNADGTWSIDFRRFGHPHDFRVARTATGVVFELATKDHGEARVEYALEPIDAKRSRLTIRLLVPTPPQVTTEQAIAMLRAKARSDLDDFELRARRAANDR